MPKTPENIYPYGLSVGEAVHIAAKEAEPQDYWKMQDWEFDLLRAGLAIDGIKIPPEQEKPLLGKIRQLRGMVLQNYLPAKNPDLQWLTLMPWEEATWIDYLRNLVNNELCVEQTRQQAANGTALFQQLTGHLPHGKAQLLSNRQAVVLLLDKAEDRERFTYKDSSGSVGEVELNGIIFPLILLMNNQSALLHEECHVVSNQFGLATKDFYPRAFNRELMAMQCESASEGLKTIVGQYQANHNLKEFIRQARLQLDLYVEAIADKGKNELLAFFKRDGYFHTWELKKINKRRNPDPQVFYDYFYDNGISEAHFSHLPQAIDMVQSAREKYFSMLDKATKSAWDLAIYLHKCQLGKNLGISTKELLMAFMRQNPLGYWRTAADMIMSKSTTQAMGVVFSKQASPEEMQTFYHDLGRPFSNPLMTVLRTLKQLPFENEWERVLSKTHLAELLLKTAEALQDKEERELFIRAVAAAGFSKNMFTGASLQAGDFSPKRGMAWLQTLYELFFSRLGMDREEVLTIAKQYLASGMRDYELITSLPLEDGERVAREYKEAMEL